MTPTERALHMRLTYPKTSKARFLVDPLWGDAKVNVDVKKRRVTGYSTAIHWRRESEKKISPLPPKTYFVIEFNKEISNFEIIKGKALVTFTPTQRGEKVTARIASSFISLEQAERNLKELHTRFNETHTVARKRWNAVLSRIKVFGGTETDKIKFYTCLYRSLIFPRMTHEYDAEGQIVHQSFYGKGVRKGRFYCDTGFWDTFRALFPLLTFVYPDKCAEMMEGFHNCYIESGWLPEWSAPFHRSAMIGQNSASVVADAYFGGCIDEKRANDMYAAMIKSANGVHPHITTVGRHMYKEYNKFGYVPNDPPHGGRSASKTLEYAYADYCIWKMGKALGKPDSETEIYLKRSGNWKNLFRDDVKSVCGKSSKGKWDPKFSPIRWDYDFVEGTPLHYTWSVFQDIPGLIKAIGGKEAFIKKLDSVFDSPPHFDGSFFGGCTHEIREMHISGFGQYAHGNQPIQHMIYLYTLAGAREKAQYWSRKAMDELYAARPDGYCGDEDNGQTSAWFVWSAMGMYPVCPVNGEYVLSKPLFDKVEISFPNGKRLVIGNDSTFNGVRKDGPTVKRSELR
jgi:predicted alpha-1,2-mannosidase